MIRSINIIHALKIQLKRSGITYRELAAQLKLSESAVKQMFASGNFSLRRLDQVCDALGLELGDLVDIAMNQESKTAELSNSQERELVADIKLLLVAYLLVNYVSVDEILEQFEISEIEIVQLLARLDRMKLIELQPGNRVRLLITSNFKWLKNGPIENFFREEVQSEFLSGNFHSAGSLYQVKNGSITRQGQLQIAERLEAVGNLFDDICWEERKQSAANRRGTTMILAIRDWQLTVFSSLQKQQKQQQ